MIDSSIPRDLRDLVEKELDQNEKVVWCGMPKPKFFTGPATGAFVFGIPWTAFMISMFILEIPQFAKEKDYILFYIFFVPLIIVGIAMLYSPLWAFKKSLKTVYVITERRAITFDNGFSVTIRSYPPNKLTEIFRRERNDGTGDIIITRKAWWDSDERKQIEELGFLRIKDAKLVESKLNQLANSIEVT